jgi:hypothetical protein
MVSKKEPYRVLVLMSTVVSDLNLLLMSCTLIAVLTSSLLPSDHVAQIH